MADNTLVTKIKTSTGEHQIDYNALANKPNADSLGVVPNTRKVNGKSLSNDITLTASDIGASPIDHNHNQYAPTYSYGTEDLTAGTSPLETGTLYFVYE